MQVLAFSLSYWFFSVNRATLLWFPLWIMLAEWARRRPRTPGGLVRHRGLVGVAFGLEVVLMLWWSWLFFTGALGQLSLSPLGVPAPAPATIRACPRVSSS